MDEVLTWILNHKQILTLLVICITNLILLIFKKKVKVVDVLTGYLSILPTYIKQAEESGLSGKEKFSMVFSCSVKYLSAVTGLSYDVVTAKYGLFINGSIEDILATPKKKEDK